MAEKRRYTVTVPDHVAEAIESRAKPLSATPTEYAADILRWWFGQGCPAVSADEAVLRKEKLSPQEIAKRVKSVPPDINALALSANDDYLITDDKIVTKLLTQLGIPNLFAQAVEHDEVRCSVFFDNHPTHWLQIDLFKGSNKPDGDGLCFSAHPKSSVSRGEMVKKMQQAAKEMGASSIPAFSQIPHLEQMATNKVP